MFVYWIDLQDVLMGRRLVNSRAERELLVAMQECGSQKVPEPRVSSERGVGEELLGGQLLQSCSYPSCPV